MALLAQDSGNGDFELTPSGNHIAVCYMVADLGIQDTGFGPKRKVRISWELSSERMSDDRPFSASKMYTLSLNEKSNLRKDLESWRGRKFSDEELKGFDLFALLGKACMLNVIHQKSETNGNTYAQVSSIGSLPKGMAAPELENDIIRFALDDPEGSTPFEKLPEWLQNKINRTPIEVATQAQYPEASMDDFEDPSIPF